MKLIHLLSILITILLIATSTSTAQTYKSFQKAGDKALSTKNYYAAYEYYKQALFIDSSDISLSYKFAKAAYYWRSYQEANYYFKKVQLSPQSKLFQDINYLHAFTQKHLMEYETAIALFQTHWKNTSNEAQKSRALKEIVACKKAIQLLQSPSDVSITHLSTSINTPYSEFAPLQIGEELFYASMKYKEQNAQGSDVFFSKILTSKNGERGRPYGKKLNPKGIHTANIAFDRAANTLYFTRCDNQENGTIRCDIFSRNLNQRRPKDIKLPINLDKTTTTHPFIYNDTIHDQKILYFSSNRSGGQGGMDIWYAILKNKKWSTPQALNQTINTPGDEITPFFHATSQTLYFASDYHDGLGGYDIFKTIQQNNTWTTPQNIGYPLNSSYNDTYFSLDAQGKKGYLSSNRQGSLSITKGACCNDIYAFSFIKEPIPEPVTPDSAIIVEREPTVDTLPKITTIPTPPVVIDNTPDTRTELASLLPIQLFFDNDHPNPRTIFTTTSLTYEETYLKYYNKKSEFIEQYTAPLRGDGKVIASNQIDIFFEEKVKGGYDKLNGVLSYLYQELQSGSPVTIYLKGYTSPRASGKYNQYLAARRISSVENYFNQWQSGKLLPYLKSRQLILIEVPLGETKASQSISDDLNDRRNSVYSVEASQERRVEIIDVKY